MLKIEKLSHTEDVYDIIGVEGNENFYANDIVVHNCEISLDFNGGFCNLTEVNVSELESEEDLLQRVKDATFLGTLQAGYTDFHYLGHQWREIAERDSLLGVSMTGIGSGQVLKYDLKKASSAAIFENARVATAIGINPAKRIGTIKPSGCLVPETVIKTDKGNLSLQEIFDINGSDINNAEIGFHDMNTKISVYDEYNNLQPITKLYINGLAETYQVEMEDDYIFEGTGNHKVKVAYKGWTQLDTITPDDFIVMFENGIDFTRKVKSIKKNQNTKMTVDIEVANTHTYQLQNGCVTHNTAALVLGSASGIHAWHNDFYIRRMRLNKDEAIYQYLEKILGSDFIEDDSFNPKQTGVLGIPIKAPEGSILRTETPLDLLERVKKFQIDWIRGTHSEGKNTHNVSVTVSVHPEEWGTITDWMWDNKEFYNGISLLDYNGGTYPQMPFEDITEEEFLRLNTLLMEKLKLFKIEDVIEEEDHTDLKGEASCAGGACEVSSI